MISWRVLLTPEIARLDIDIGPCAAEDLPVILGINNAATPEMNELELSDVERFLEISRYFRVARCADKIAGFLIAVDPNTDYASLNYGWFRERYEEFLYIDRVAVVEPFRRIGVGRVLYADVQSYAEQRFPLLTCEVNLEPRNDGSLLFHSTIGFREVGVQSLPDGKTVSLLAKELTSYEYVRTRDAAEKVRQPDSG